MTQVLKACPNIKIQRLFLTYISEADFKKNLAGRV